MRNRQPLNFLRNGGSLKALRKILRHTDLKTTQIYMHLGDMDVMSEHTEASPLDHVNNSKE